ncbi:hypothetical protein TSAR_010684 [Trichomalopsis sarcophagae]|uniref:IGFBP N-terminal domain-containing protein n=1 Tax=Trichomalopsis sarcophagae TaxID=543379 RepID=A0A232F1L9_9HYME|nr:hypothetical protein TSAR_010684 [Trichomalopsis sarcophagae]
MPCDGKNKSCQQRRELLHQLKCLISTMERKKPCEWDEEPCPPEPSKCRVVACYKPSPCQPLIYKSPCDPCSPPMMICKPDCPPCEPICEPLCMPPCKPICQPACKQLLCTPSVPCRPACPPACRPVCPPPPCQVVCPVPCRPGCPPSPCQVICPVPCPPKCSPPCQMTCPMPCPPKCPPPCPPPCPPKCQVMCPVPCPSRCPPPKCAPRLCYTSCSPPEPKMICAPLKRCKSFELRSSLMQKCHCIKRNGLQDRCLMMDCMGYPECMTKLFPICDPGQCALLKLCYLGGS